jgi:hypothetical protein
MSLISDVSTKELLILILFNTPAIVGIVGVLDSLSKPTTTPWAKVRGILFYLTKKNPLEYFFSSSITNLSATMLTPITGNGAFVVKNSDESCITPLAFSFLALPPMI